MKSRTKRHLDLLPRPELRVVKPLEEPWRALLDDLARSRGFPTTSDVAKLGELVAKLSATYNASGPDTVNARTEPAHAARLLFSFPRDVPKSAGAVRELVAHGDFVIPADRPLRVLDLGAGLGATSWGVARALAAQAIPPGSTGRIAVEITLVDSDPLALNLALAIHERAAQLSIEPNLHLTIATKATSVASFFADPGTADAGFDLILAGQVMSELDRALDPEARAESHAKRLATWMGWLRKRRGAALVVVEPALRDRSRHLHAVRDRLLARRPESYVLAPCLHEAPCPALATESEWCHDDVPIDLPEWLVPVARAAGLRWQNLSFSPLVLANGSRVASETVDATEATEATDATEGRVISDPLVSKGKIEAFVCAPQPRTSDADSAGEIRENGETESARGAARRIRVMRLDRQAAPHNEAWSQLARYDRLRFAPSIVADDAGRVRLSPETTIDRYLAEPSADAVTDEDDAE